MLNSLAAVAGAFALLAIALLCWAIPKIVTTTMEQMLTKKFERQMELFKRDMWVHEQSAKAAEYLAMALELKSSDDPELFRRANQLGWELAMYAEPNVYRDVVAAIANPSESSNYTTAVIAVRKFLLAQKSGDLSSNDIAFHSSDIAKRIREHAAKVES